MLFSLAFYVFDGDVGMVQVPVAVPVAGSRAGADAEETESDNEAAAPHQPPPKVTYN